MLPGLLWLGNDRSCRKLALTKAGATHVVACGPEFPASLPSLDLAAPAPAVGKPGVVYCRYPVDIFRVFIFFLN